MATATKSKSKAVKAATTFDEHAAIKAAAATIPGPDEATPEQRAAAVKDAADKIANKGIAPGAPEFDWQAEYPGEPVFVFTAASGATVGMTALAGKRKPKPGYLRKLSKLDQLTQMFTILEIVSSPAALQVSDEFEDEDYANMFEQWSAWSKTTAGESSR